MFNMKRVLLDTSIYGELILDPEIDKIKEKLDKANSIFLYGNSYIRKELRNTAKKKKIQGKNLKVYLLNIYDAIVKDHNLNITNEMKNVAKGYYKIYRELGVSKSFREMSNDFMIVACASVHGLDIIVSKDNSTMMTENALRTYNIVNLIKSLKNINFIEYEKFRRLFS